ncbi:MAG: tyrosine-type recombinase/integrase [Chloroflexi bacterium]|nr:tyrosine-type recombinase/integrase [Chloroflexota bacterium]
MKSDKLIEPFAKALEDYREGYMAARNLAPRTRVDYENDIVQFLEYLQETKIKDLKNVERRHVMGYLAELDKKKLTGLTRRRKQVVIRGFFDWLKINDEVEANPAKHVPLPQREEKEPRFLTRQEYQRLLAAVQKPRDRAIIQMILGTGIRLSELHRLDLSDLIGLPKRITSTSTAQMIIRGKGRKTRTVYVLPKALEALKSWLAARPEVEIQAVFLSSRNLRISRRQIQYLVDKYLKLANIKGAGVHSLRHTYATYQQVKGRPITSVQKNLEHNDIASTAVYAHILDDEEVKQMLAAEV